MDVDGYSKYGQEVSLKLSYELSKQGVSIASGMAKGIDSYSHIGCINAGGKTIAVLGNGLDQIYPKENIGLYNKIIQTGGLVLSEYVIGTKATKLNFPARNRIISGISKGVIVVEAKQKSRYIKHCRLCTRPRKRRICNTSET